MNETRTKEEIIQFWNKKAKTFPRYSPGTDCYEEDILNLARSLGVDFRSKSILDVCAGSGMYTLRLAREASKVVAIDISEEMLRVSRQDADSYGIKNIRYVLSDFSTFAEDDAYDIVFCSMSPGVAGDSGKDRVFALAREFAVFVGYSKFSNPDFIDTLLDGLQVRSKDFRSTDLIKDYLSRKGINYSLAGKKGTWEGSYTQEEILDYAAATLFDYKAGFREEEVIGFLEPYRDARSGLYRTVTPYEVEVIVCPVSS
jgi:SAM-dependent methyltransferase